MRRTTASSLGKMPTTVSGKLRPSGGVVPWHKRVDFAARPAVGDTLNC